MRTPEWISRCEAVSDAELDIGVHVWDSFYIGPGNEFSPEQWRDLRVPLYRPRVNHRAIRRPDPPPDIWSPTVRYVSLPAATPNEVLKLQRYFADALRVMAEHGRLRSSDPIFDLSLRIFVAGDCAIGWSWHRKWAEIRGVLDALAAPVKHPRIVYDDVEQGWQVIVFATPTVLFIRQSDFDTGEEQRLISCQRESIGQQVARLNAVVPALLTTLEGELGRPGLFGLPTAP